MVRRVYVEKKPSFAVQAKDLRHEIRHYLNIAGCEDVRVFIRYDVENISDEVFEQAAVCVFSEPPVDRIYFEKLPEAEDAHVFSVEYLPGQFDQRADSAEQCIRFLDEREDPTVRSATTYMILGDITEEELAAIESDCINPVDSRLTDEVKPKTLLADYPEPEDVAVFTGFAEMEEEPLLALYRSLGLAMTFEDFKFIQAHFAKEEHRDPTVTEIRVLDTYWSDHCRHTTFLTELKHVTFGEGDMKKPIEDTFRQYLADRGELYRGRSDKFVCLMDLALLGAKKLKAEGKLADQEESDEINACSIVVPVDVNGVEEEWLINFKNETHNHPTEIEPFGGAATCLGGAIRDPLSGRTYVYQAMRVTGAADPTVPQSETLPGKLPQKKLVRQAARGYSSYGNQIGLATGFVKEIYHPNYVAKRMEIGAVIAAAPRRAVQRLTSDPGDVIILLGGRTGRDGIGGATGSSKAHNTESTNTCGAEVQKGNAPTERKLQRLFRREEVAHLIKKCNDFGAGGVSVAIGELADGLMVELDRVPKKYAGLDGTELAISESQERMAVVVDPKDVEQFLAYAAEENLEATPVAVVTEEPRLVLNWRGKKIVDLSRAFLDTNGAHQETDVFVEIPDRWNSEMNLNGDVIDLADRGSQCLLPEGPCGDVRQLHRRRLGADALRREVPADRDPGHGGEGSGGGRGDEYGHSDELRLRSEPDELEPLSRRGLGGRILGGEDRCGRRRRDEDPLHLPGIFPENERGSEALEPALRGAIGRLCGPDRLRPALHRRQGLHVRVLRGDRCAADAGLLRGGRREAAGSDHAGAEKAGQQTGLDPRKARRVPAA